MMWALCAGALGAEIQDHQSPNSTIGASVGSPYLLGGHGEAWLADEASVEVGAGALGGVEPFGFDATLRWRPDILCLACGRRALVTLGVGVGTVVVPSVGFEGPWSFAAGPDLAATAVYWMSPAVGLALSVHGGIGPGWEGTAFDEITVAPWGFATAGLAF
jgi:hypothetical protein